MLLACEAEYVAATSCVCHAIWLRKLLKDLNVPQGEPTVIRIDSKSAIALAKNPVFHERSKHIDTRYHYIRECIARKETSWSARHQARSSILARFVQPKDLA